MLLAAENNRRGLPIHFLLGNVLKDTQQCQKLVLVSVTYD
jgi:hypothetical protein